MPDTKHLLTVCSTGLMIGMVIGIMIDYYKPKRLIKLLQRIGLFKNRDT